MLIIPFYSFVQGITRDTSVMDFIYETYNDSYDATHYIVNSNKYP